MKTDFGTEVVAGVKTSLTMSYIVLVNPAILAQAGMHKRGVLTATALVCFLSSVLRGLLANLPYAVGPGMGITAFLVYSIVVNGATTWQTALGATVFAGIIFLLVTCLNIRRLIFLAIPLTGKCLKTPKAGT
ncbi:MAG: solute carrier family 23 protein [Thermodesulfobacteriota bacterium]|nr:solute carrier family 23 protein [Thermodesulfobacteriota bacterium]